MKKHILEELAETNLSSEIWWDSSPLVFENWKKATLKAAPDSKKAQWEVQLRRLFDPENPAAMFFRGVTTNPPLSYSAIKDDPRFWAVQVQNTIEENPGKSVEEIFWLTYKQIIRKGAEMVRPLWEKSGKKYGFVSGQVDPRNAFEYEKMLEQALEISKIAPNVMVKAPGTKQGYDIIEKLTSLGIPTNNTSSFCVPQYMRLMDAVSKGLKAAKENGVDLSRWRSVITHMSGRFGFLGDLKVEAQARGIELSDAEIVWADLMLFKRAYFWGKEQNHPSKMLQCSMRMLPQMPDGSKASWHVEKLAGADCVYTMPPKYIAELMNAEDDFAKRPFNKEAIFEMAPETVMDKLQRLPYFVKSYEYDGMSVDEFNRYAPLIATTAEFSAATRGMVDFVAQQFQKLGKWELETAKSAGKPGRRG